MQQENLVLCRITGICVPSALREFQDVWNVVDIWDVLPHVPVVGSADLETNLLLHKIT